ncbi:hypothetical protein MKX03_005075 [Papaver bracteatum]|nr:hypothetical protein MKX03_005075 [Papaver bracteatum]
MVQGMRDVITDIVRDFALCQQDAARFWQDANRYYCELEELKFRMGGNMVVSPDLMAPGCPTRKRKMTPEESDPCKVKVAQIHQPEYLPLSIRSSAMPASTIFPVQASVTKDNENDIPCSISALGKFVNKEPLLYCAEMQTGTAESLVLVEPVEESVEALMTSSSPTCQTVKPTMTPLPATWCQTEGIEFAEKFKIPKEYESLYKNILDKHGHMAPTKVTKSNDDILPALVIRLLKINSAMETMPVAELSEPLLETWEGDIKCAETLEFNIKWLRQKFNEVKKYWRLDKEIERHEQELDSTQLKYIGLWARKQELDKEIAEVKVQIRNAEAKISSEREAIQEKLAQIYDQIHSEPATGTFLG